MDDFLKQMGQLYEIVVFTASLSKVRFPFLKPVVLCLTGFLQYADPVLDKLDIHRVVAHRLFRESCFNHKGNYVKVRYALSPWPQSSPRVHRISLNSGDRLQIPLS